MSLEALSPPRLHFFPINVGEASPESTFSILNKASYISVERGEASSRGVEAATRRVKLVVFSCEVVGSFEEDAIGEGESLRGLEDRW